MTNTNERLKPNGCGEDSGYDYYECWVKQKFEDYAVRKGYNLTKNRDYGFFYEDVDTQEAWSMYHHGHVAGRTFKVVADE